MDFIFVEDPALEGASPEELRPRFQGWARKNARGTGSRHNFFITVDGEGLWNCYVNLVQAWPYSSEDWMKMRTSDIGPDLYVQLHNDEVWYVYYKDPELGVAEL